MNDEDKTLEQFTELLTKWEDSKGPPKEMFEACCELGASFRAVLEENERLWERVVDLLAELDSYRSQLVDEALAEVRNERRRS